MLQRRQIARPCRSAVGKTAVIPEPLEGNLNRLERALTGPAEWQKWIDSIDLVESLRATTIIAGHKQPDASDQDLETILDGSRGYIRDFRDAVARSSTAKEVIGTTKANTPTMEA